MRALSPSDLARVPAFSRVRIAGRISTAQAETCELADAFSSVRVRSLVDPALAPGELVVFEGVYEGGALRDAVVVERTPCAEPRGDGDWARFAWQGVGHHLQARARALSAVRDYFGREHFLEVETPLRVPAPGVDLHLDAIPAHGGYLITSPELHMKRLLAAGFPRIFQLARASRADELGRLHEPGLSRWFR